MSKLDALFLAGLLLIVAGIAFIYWQASLIVAGSACIYIAWQLQLADKREASAKANAEAAPLKGTE